MKILLISENATIQKLFSLTAEKRGDVLFIGKKDAIPEDNYELVFIDSDIFSSELFNYLKNSFVNAKFILLMNKNEDKIEGFDEYITKPFLPTDIIEILNKFDNKEESLFNKDVLIEEDRVNDFENVKFDEVEINELNNKDIDESFLVKEDELEEFSNIDDNHVENRVDLEEEGDDILENNMLNVPNELDNLNLELGDRDKENLEELSREDINSNISLEKENNLLEDDNLEDNNIDEELKNLSEEDIASVLDEDIKEPTKKDFVENSVENFDVKEEKEEFIENSSNTEIKKIKDVLNINWEELKKAKAKITITIDFGG